ncbi:MAG TPA: DegT/DnrJ/EryC1/StrS family aminotransferase [Candidatus Nanoarchaeia archaeon]|nr:DegT/DnrJ/EryC1/StrS family aminotransferase [Candidatus Nanoarchaeia archaeon]
MIEKEIPQVDLKRQYHSIKKEIDEAIFNIIENTSFINGKAVQEFEEDFAKFCNAKYCIGVSSGTSAVEVALQASGIKAGDEVITVPNTFIATTEAITRLGAKFKFVDIDEKTYTIDINQIEKAITSKTKAILPVQLYGQSSEMDKIKEIAEIFNLKVIEDCAQAHGAEYNNKRLPYSLVGTFSFFPAKNLGSFGDAGAVVTNDEEIANKARLLKDHGRTGKYVHEIEGYNHRLDTLQAAILKVKLKKLDEWIEKRRENVALYNELLSDNIIKPIERENSKHVYYVYTIRVKNRDGLQKYLKENKISSQIYYPIPLHLQPAYSHLGYKKGDFPVTEKVCDEILSLPLFPELTKEEIEYISEKVNSFI